MEQPQKRTKYDQAVGSQATLLLLIAVMILHVGIHDGSPQPWIEWTELLLTLAVVAVANYMFRRPAAPRSPAGTDKGSRCSNRSQESQLTTHALPARHDFLLLLTFCSLPFLIDIGLRRLLAHGNPLEIQLTLAIRNLTLGLNVLPQQGSRRLAVFCSLFLAIYGALVTVSTAMYGLLAAYCLCGLWWLMGEYWRRLSPRFPDDTATEIPYVARVGALVLVLFGLVGGAVAIQTDAVTGAVAGFLPSSGGSGGSDPFARGGIGDGDQLVGATKDASSFGPIESELFLESKQPTLYDMFIETYQPPSIRKRESRSRAIPLSSEFPQKQNHTNLAQNKKASREFSAMRSPAKQRPRRQLKDTKSTAVLYVAGRTPLHLGLAVYDHWDGHTLSLQAEKMPEPRLLLAGDTQQRNWATWNGVAQSGQLAAAEEHVLKIINLDSPTIPAPPHLTAIHIDKLHDQGFFRWEDGLLRLRGDKIPSLTVLHVKSRPLRSDHLRQLDLRRDATPVTAVSNRIGELARRVVGDAGTDWERVTRIRDWLRSLHHDANALVPEGVDDAVEHFLFDTQRGPDFLFATSAAVMLRSLGYQTRVISGLYADPNNYDRVARGTGVYTNDIHFWTEVRAADGGWIAVEPTPGFEILRAKLTLGQTAAELLHWLAAAPVTCAIVILTLVVVVKLRRPLYAAIAVARWRLGLHAAPRQQILRSISLLQTLPTRQQARRRTGQTVDDWLVSLNEQRSETTPLAAAATETGFEPTPDSGRSVRVIQQFRLLVAWACYASSGTPDVALEIPSASVKQICVDSVRQLKQGL